MFNFVFVFFEKLPKSLGLLFAVILLILLTSITVKVIDNFFFGGDPAYVFGEEIGFANNSNKAYVSWANYNVNFENYQECGSYVFQAAKENSFFDSVTFESDRTIMFSGPDVFVAFCATGNALDITGASSDRSRGLLKVKIIAKYLKERLIADGFKSAPVADNQQSTE